MKRFLLRYRTDIHYRKRVNLIFAVFFNFLMFATKALIAIWYGIFFLVSGFVNLSIALSKGQCFLGLTNRGKWKFKERNIVIATLTIFAGIQYTIYMLRLVIWDSPIMTYPMQLACIIALISFIEVGLVIKEFFSDKTKGTYYRDMKLINLCSSMSAMVLTTLAILSFASETDDRQICGIMGTVVGFLMIVIAIFIITVPLYSVIDHNSLTFKSPTSESSEDFVVLKTYCYGNYRFQGKSENGIFKGYIVRDKSELRNAHPVTKAFLILFSEILVFGYLVGAFVLHFQTIGIRNKIIETMTGKGYEHQKSSSCDEPSSQ